jgi:hypothetical protein
MLNFPSSFVCWCHAHTVHIGYKHQLANSRCNIEEMWLKCVFVKKRVHDILAIAYEANFGDNGPIRERQIACERVSEIMCPAKHRHVLYHNELIRMGAIGSSTTGSIASTSHLLI